MLYSEIIAVYSEIHTTHINAVCGHSAELLNVQSWPPMIFYIWPRLESLSGDSKMYIDLWKPPSLQLVTCIVCSECARLYVAFLLFLVQLCVWWAEDHIIGIRTNSFTCVDVH